MSDFPPSNKLEPLSGGQLWLTAMILAAANFIAILDLTIANVSIPNIAGALGVTTSQGTWVITSYAVAEAISVPLTGWLTARFGPVRLFVTAVALFGIFSAICGIANSLGMLVVGRVFLGLSGGLMVPLSQTLLLRIFPKDKAPVALGLSAVTTLVAPILGPILGGYICDNWSWPWIFLINTPFAIICAMAAWRELQRYEEDAVRNPIDAVGLVLLIIWVGALQLLIDKGVDLDWFASNLIVVLAIIAAVGFAAFLIWELHEEHPVVDLRIFRYRGYSFAVLSLSLGIGILFGANVLTPLWLQNLMGYTSTQAGQALAWMGVTAVLMSPVAAVLSSRFDPRWIAFAGTLWIALISLWRSDATIEMGYWQVSIPLMLLGLGLPIFFLPLQVLALGSVEENETASATGLLNFLRTLAGAVATSLVMTAWDDGAKINHAELVGSSDNDHGLQSMLEAAGMTNDAALHGIDQLINAQALMLATNQVMAMLGIAATLAAFVIWLAPKPLRIVDLAATAGH